MNYHETILSGIRQILKENNHEFSTSRFSLFPWPESIYETIDEWRISKSYSSLASIYHLAGHTIRHMFPHFDSENGDNLYIQGMLVHIASLFDYLNGNATIAKQTAILNATIIEQTLQSLNVRQIQHALFIELLADIHLLIDHNRSNSLYDQAIQMIESSTDSEMEEIYSYYWDSCETEWTFTMRTCFDFDFYPGEYRKYDQRIPFKKALQNRVHLK